MRQLDFDYGTTVPIIIFIYHDPLVQSIHVSLYAAVFLSGIILENNLYNGTDWTSIQIVCVMIWLARITSSWNGPELSYRLTDHKEMMPNWGTKVCLAFPVLYVMLRRSLCPAPWLSDALGPRSAQDVHLLMHTLPAPFHLPHSYTFSVKPPQLHFILALANLPAHGSVVDLLAAQMSSGCTRESLPCSRGQQCPPGPPLKLLQSCPFAFLLKSRSRLYVKALIKLSTKGNMHK